MLKREIAIFLRTSTSSLLIMRKINTLVVGQGLAGSVFSFMLHREGISFLVMDPAMGLSASMVAAGMFTPISGQRKTIHPLTLRQIPFAQKFSAYRL